MSKNRDKLHDLLESGALDALTLARNLMNWLSDDECQEFAQANDIQLDDDDEAVVETEDYTLPAHWASALINGDRSGLDDADEADLEAWLATHPDLGDCPTCTDEEEFRTSHDATGVGVLACNCLTFTFPKN